MFNFTIDLGLGSGLLTRYVCTMSFDKAISTRVTRVWSISFVFRWTFGDGPRLEPVCQSCSPIL